MHQVTDQLKQNILAILDEDPFDVRIEQFITKLERIRKLVEN